MCHYIDMEGDEINLVVSIEIVNVIIGEMLFRPEDELELPTTTTWPMLATATKRWRSCVMARCSCSS